MKKSLISIILMSAMSFVAGFIAFTLLLARFGHYPAIVSVGGGILGGAAVAYTQYYHMRMRANIKAIVREFNLTSDDLAAITGERSTNFPIYRGDLALVIPKRRWGSVEKKLQAWAAQQSSTSQRPNIKKR
ncbi:hypothetical protein [Schleiferilactobacillus perolens]|nr:hypothetical protein [Schleiferilactobacillus perolens]MCI2172339.1 hypothetical protein [Schleiferilactobacillus perolens]